MARPPIATDEELQKAWDSPPGQGWNAGLRAVYDLGRQHGSAQATCPHIVSGAEGTSYCRLAEQTAAPVTLMDGLRAASAEARPGGLVERDPECVASWPDCYEGGYDPRCCRFPKSCSCSVRRSQPGPIPEARPGKRLWERMEEAGRCELADNPMAEQAEFYQAMIREVAAAALQMHPDKNLTWERVALWLHQEADR